MWFDTLGESQLKGLAVVYAKPGLTINGEFASPYGSYPVWGKPIRYLVGSGEVIKSSLKGMPQSLRIQWQGSAEVAVAFGLLPNVQGTKLTADWMNFLM